MADFDSVIPAGQPGELKAKIHTRPNQHGRLSKGISVTTDAPDARNLRLTMTMEVVTPIFIKPRYQLYINTVVGSDSDNSILLSRSDGKKLEVSLYEPPPEGIKVEISEAKDGERTQHNVVAEKGNVWVKAIAVNPREVETRTEKILLKTNHPDRPMLSIPLTVRVRSEIEARPAQVRVWITEQSKPGQSTIFRLTNNSAKSFGIKKATSSMPDLFSVTQTTNGQSRSHQFMVKLGEAFDQEAFDQPVSGSVTITTDSEATPTITVPVLLSSRGRPMPNTRNRSGLQEKLKPSRQAPPIVRPTQTPGVG